MPIATGYVHFVVPLRSISFKNGGTLVPIGTMVRDEGAAVVGINEKRYTTAPINVQVNMLGQEPRSYQYHVVNEPTMSAMLAAVSVFYSIDAIHGMPIENTAKIDATMRFSGGREIDLNTMVSGGSSVSLVYELLPILSVMVQNPFEMLEIEGMDVVVDIDKGNNHATIIEAKLDQSEVAPGDVVGVDLKLQHFTGPTVDRRIEIKVPDDIEEGDYPLTISDAATYTRIKMMSRPHRTLTRSIDDLVYLLEQLSSIPVDQMYATIQVPEGGLAVGKTEMPTLPSSRAAILMSPTRTDIMAFPGLIEQTFDADAVIEGAVSFNLSVRQP